MLPLQIGDIVETLSLSFYSNVIPIGSTGKIVHVRLRYHGTPNEYSQYIVDFGQSFPPSDMFFGGNAAGYAYAADDLNLKLTTDTDSDSESDSDSI